MVTWAAILVTRYGLSSKRRVDAFMIHRLFLAALWVVIKVHCDTPPRAKLYAHLCGMSTWEIPRLETELLKGINFDMFVSQAEIEDTLLSFPSQHIFMDISSG
jgi:hypothetical protein